MIPVRPRARRRLVSERVRFEACDAAILNGRHHFIGRGPLLHHFGEADGMSPTSAR
jgi:hypothetical protein